MKEIIVTINNGEAEIRTSGFSGGDCLKATMAIEKALGKKTADTATAEMRKPVTQTLKAGA
jgi:hypothetical protein